MENKLEKVLQFEGQEIKVITDKGIEMFNLGNSCRVLGLTQSKKNGTKVIKWTRVKEKINNIYSGIQNRTPQDIALVEEINYILDEIENTDDRNSIYMSRYLTSRLAMECHSDKANEYKDWLAKLDLSYSKGELQLDNNALMQFGDREV